MQDTFLLSIKGATYCSEDDTEGGSSLWYMNVVDIALVRHCNGPVARRDWERQMGNQEQLLLESRQASPTGLSRWCVLEPLRDSDYPVLLQAAQGNWLHWRWMEMSPDLPQFRTLLWSGVLTQYGIRRTVDDHFMGIVGAYGHNYRHQHTYLRVALLPEFQRRGWPLFGVVQFINSLFIRFPLRKIYVEVFGVMPALARVLPREGCLRDHVQMSTGVANLEIFAIYRDWWTEHGRILMGNGS
jgi:hypothetical protein